MLRKRSDGSLQKCNLSGFFLREARRNVSLAVVRAVYCRMFRQALNIRLKQTLQAFSLFIIGMLDRKEIRLWFAIML